MTEKEKEKEKKEEKSKKGLLAGLFKGSGGSGCCCNIRIVPADEEESQGKPVKKDGK